jgi:hypothetical protein
MVSYTTDQKMFVIKTFYSSRGSCVDAERQCCRGFSVRVAPSRDTIGLSNGLKNQEVCVINLLRDLNVAYQFVRKKSVEQERQ